MSNSQGRNKLVLRSSPHVHPYTCTRVSWGCREQQLTSSSSSSPSTQFTTSHQNIPHLLSGRVLFSPCLSIICYRSSKLWRAHQSNNSLCFPAPHVSRGVRQKERKKEKENDTHQNRGRWNLLVRIHKNLNNKKRRRRTEGSPAATCHTRAII